MINKRGQIQLSFTMIFSIIIIIVTVAVAFYFIQKFLATGECISTKLFKKDLQEAIDNIWRAPAQAQQQFSENLPSGVKKVCFGSPNSPDASIYPDIKEQFNLYSKEGDNFFIYPAEKACGGSVARQQINHVRTDGFNCFNVIDRKVSFKIGKNSSTDAFVRIKTNEV